MEEFRRIYEVRRGSLFHATSAFAPDKVLVIQYGLVLFPERGPEIRDPETHDMNLGAPYGV